MTRPLPFCARRAGPLALVAGLSVTPSVTVDKLLGRWAAAQMEYFSDGALYDRVIAMVNGR